MKFKKLPVKYHNNDKGVYAIAPNISDKDQLLSWIQKKDYEGFICDENRLIRHTRKRNKLFSFQHPIIDKRVILKVSTIDNQYKLSRRFNLHISTMLNDYNFRAFTGACFLHANNISCPAPIAYWNEKKFFLVTKSYYLYEKVEAQDSAHSFTQKLLTLEKSSYEEILHILAEKIIQIIQNIHSAGFRQGDPHPGNFLISNLEKEITQLSPKDVTQAKLSIIDLDKFSISRLKIASLQRFFDIRCLRRCTLGNLNQQDMLKIYLKENYTNTWAAVLSFWMFGGFNFTKWFKSDKKKK